MKELFGILFLDQAEIILRIYQIDDKNWRLLHYLSRDLGDFQAEKTITAVDITGAITEFLGMRPTQHVGQWRVCSRGVPPDIIHTVSEATGLSIELLLAPREQELLCKGMFTEMW